MSLINLNSIKDFAQKTNFKIELQRFRANFYVEGIKPWEERNWIGIVIEINNSKETIIIYIIINEIFIPVLLSSTV